MDSDNTVPTDEGEAVAAESFFSTTDYFVLALLAGFLFYWFVVRSKPKPKVDIRPIIPPTINRSSSYDPSFVSKMKKTGRNVVIFYGSQTGTAEEFAGRLSKDSQRYGMRGMAADPEEYDMDDLAKLTEIDNALVIFMMATYGEGDPTDNAHELYDWLQSDQDLNGVNYTVFGLGNKTYEHYNAMGIFVDKRLSEMGATRVFELGLGDDDSNIEEDFVTWKERFWPAVCEHFGIEATGEDVSMRQYELEIHETKPERVFTGEPARYKSYSLQRPPFDAKNPFMAKVTVNRSLTDDCPDRDVIHMELDITDSRIRYEAGDHVAVYPTNDPTLVQKLGDRLEVDLDVIFSLNNLDEESNRRNPFPNPCSYRTALLHYVDITSRPRTHILKELSEYCSDPADKDKLVTMASSSEEGRALYKEWILDDHRHIFLVLSDLPSLKPPLDHLLELMPRLQARYYSIASSAKVHPNSIHVTAALVSFTTRVGNRMNGVATSWLVQKTPTESLTPTVPIYVRKSQFRLPFRSTTPVLMVGPGTGLAPFRGFIQQRDLDRKSDKPLGDTILYYGCRYEAKDYLYKEELQEYKESGTLNKLYTAFSRDTDQKVYVQHLLQKNVDEVWNVLENGGHVYVCGDARNMARDVHKCFHDVIVSRGNKTSEEAEEYIKKLQQRGRYQQDVWS